MPGTRLDRYELICPVAHGGMASVWVARLTGKHGFEKLFAVKTILPHYAQDPRFQKMFLDEARVASRIEHNNVAQVLDLGEANDILYLVMEWVDGDSLSKLSRAVRRRGAEIPVGVVLRVLADICGGLHAAHEVRGDDGEVLGVVHRDVSPQNILVNTKGIAKLIDFGVVKARGRVGGETGVGQLKGKIHYMAPEQALGRAIDRRADVWSIAAVAYHLLAGVPVYDGENELATLHLLTSGAEPPPLPASVPPALAGIVLGALRADPDRRSPGSAVEMQRALERVMLDIGHATSVDDVASFARPYLVERAEARKKALDTALRAAAERRRVHGILTPLENDSSSGVNPSPLEVEVAVDSDEWRLPRAASEDSSASSNVGSVPSVASTATLGSAASEVERPVTRAPAPGFRGATLAALLVLAGLAVVILSFRKTDAGATHSPAEVPTVAAAEPAADPVAPAVASPAAPSAAAPRAAPEPVASAVGSANPAGSASLHPAVRPKATAPHPPAKKDYGF